MSKPTLRKDFFVQPDWTEDQARALNDFLDRVTAAMPCVRTGGYIGTGRENEIELVDMPGAPLLVMLQADTGGAIYTALVPYLSGEITLWSRKSFTLAAAAAHNAANTSYRYLSVA